MAQVSFRPARVFAMQLLYAMEITGQTVAQALPGAIDAQPTSEGRSFPDAQKKYGMKLVDLILEHRDELDEEIKAAAMHWELDRMAKLDRIILQISMVELSYIPDVPVKVAISEAIQIAEKFSTDGSAAFVNGLLAGFMQKRGIVVPGSKEKK